MSTPTLEDLEAFRAKQTKRLADALGLPAKLVDDLMMCEIQQLRVFPNGLDDIERAKNYEPDYSDVPVDRVGIPMSTRDYNHSQYTNFTQADRERIIEQMKKSGFWDKK